MNRIRGLLDYRFTLVAAVYVMAVLLCWARYERPPDRDYLAVRELVNNHRIVAGDFRRPASSHGFYMADSASIEGKYVKSVPSIPAGDRVRVAALADKPHMDLPPNTQALAFPLPNESRLMIGLLEVGSAVVLLGQELDSKAALSIPATVHAILCEPPKGDGGTCFPILQIPTDQVHVVTKNQPVLRLTLRSKH